MGSEESPMWNSIHYRADSDGKPIEVKTRSTVFGLVESGFTSAKAPRLTRISESVSIEVHSTPPSEASSTSSDGDVDEWEDVEPDEESVTFKSLIDEKPFSSLAQMCNYDRNQCNFDLVATRKRLGK
jgi:hypothetical protein